MGNPRSRGWLMWFWVRALFLACRWQPSYCFLIGQRKGRDALRSLLTRALIPSGGLHSQDLVTFQEVPYSSAITLWVLKDKWKHIKLVRAYVSKNQFKLSSTSLELVEVLYLPEPGERVIKKCRSKAKKLFNWLSLKCLPYLGKPCCLQLVILRFWFLNFAVFPGLGLRLLL